ncbi:hypothetical protein OH786_19180 [Streptomyces atratus]|uniref:Uncharacterized protein n=1 Tax=Streptomyces atratus TaxID=1893 RepID=A0A1K2DHS9_STRAR|nr:hypothetical protein [Streptomyces atratus]SFY22943.1 hypothetical protein SAMN02787144_101489 [Streptomyces atratus]
MDVGNATAAAVAFIGVVGTLLSALLTQRAADRSRQRENTRAERLRARRSEAEARHSTCVALNTAARQYLAALTDQFHALGGTEDPGLVRRRLVEARDLHREAHAEAQLRLPERILGIADEVSHGLGTLYGRLLRLADGMPRPGDSPTAAKAEIDVLWDRLRTLRREMREELRETDRDDRQAEGDV